MACKLVINDLVLISLLSKNSFETLQEFQDEIYETFVVKGTPFPTESLITLSSGKIFRPTKFGRIFKLDGDRLTITISLPQDEVVDNFRFNLKNDPDANVVYNKYNIEINAIEDANGITNPDLDTLTTLWLGNFFSINSNEDLKYRMDKGFPKLFADFIKQATNYPKSVSTGINKNVIEKAVEIYRLFEQIAQDRKIPINPVEDVESLIDQTLNIVKDQFENKDVPTEEEFKKYTTKEDAQKIQDEKDIKKYEEEINQTPTLTSDVSFLHSDLKNPIPPDTSEGENIALARTLLLQGIKEVEGEFRVRVTKGQIDFVQPHINQNGERWLTPEQVLGVEGKPSVVGIVEQKINGQWLPVYLKGSGKITMSNVGNFEVTTNSNEAKNFTYKVGDVEYTSNQLYLQVNKDIREEFLVGSKQPDYEQFHMVKGVNTSTKYISLNETGIPLSQVIIATKGVTKGIPRVLTSDLEHFEYPVIDTLNDKEIQELIPLLEHVYDNTDDLEKAIIYLNKLISIGEFNTLTGRIYPAEKTKSQDYAISRRAISFYPNQDFTRIEVVVERVKVGDGFKTNLNQKAFFYETNPQLVISGLQAAHVNIPKSTEQDSNQVGTYPSKMIVEKTTIKSVPWSIQEQHQWIETKIKTRLKMIDGKIINPHLSLVVYKNALKTQVKEKPNEFTIKGFKIVKDQLVESQIFRTSINQRLLAGEAATLNLYYQAISNDLNAKVIFVSNSKIQELKEDNRDYPAIYDSTDNIIYFNFDYFKNPNNQKDLFRIFVEESIHELTYNELKKDSVKNTEEYQRLESIRLQLQSYKEEYLQTLSESVRERENQRINYYTQDIEEFATSIAVGRMVHFMDWANNKVEYKEGFNLIEQVVQVLKRILSKLLNSKGLSKQVISDILKIAYKKTTPVEVIEEFNITISDVPPELDDPMDIELDEDFLKELKDFKGVEKKRVGSFAPKNNETPIKYFDMLASKVLFENRAEGNATFGDFIQGNVVTGTLWKGMLKALADEFQIASNERKIYLKGLIDNRNTILSEWQDKSKLFKFNEDKISINEDGLVSDEDTQEENLMESNEGDSKFADRTEQKLSSIESGDRLAQIFIRMTPKIKTDKQGNPLKEYDLDENGNLIPSDYTSLWNTIADVTAGSLTIEEMIQKMKNSNKLWEIRVVVERLENLSNSLTDIIVRKSFERSFAKFLIPTLILNKTWTESEVTYDLLNSGNLDTRKIEDSVAQGFREFAEDNNFLIDYKVEIEGIPKTITGINFSKLLLKLDGITKAGEKVMYTYKQDSLIEFWQEIGMMIPDIAKQDFGFYPALDNLTKKLREKVRGVVSRNSEMAISDSKITMSNLNLIEFIKKDQVFTVNGITQSFAGEPGIVRNLTEVLSNYLPFTTSNMTKNADGENQSNLHTFSSWLLNIKYLNEGALDKVWRLQNPITKYSLVRKGLALGKKITPVNLSGSVVIADDSKNGITTINLGTIDYLKQEFFTLLTEGTKENIRAETANSSFGFQFVYDNNSKLPISTDKFTSNFYIDRVNNIFSDYLRGEIERIKLEKESDYEYWSKYNRIKENLSLFKDILSLENRNLILDGIDQSLSVEQIIKTLSLKENFRTYFDKKVQNFKDEVFIETGISIDKNNPIFEGVQREIATYGLEAVIKSFVINSSIISIEEVILFHGELGMFDKFFKRSKSNISNGTPVVINEGARNYLLEEGNTFSELSTGEVPKYYKGIINDSIVIADDLKIINNPEEFAQAVQESLEETGKIFGKEVSKDAGIKKIQKYLQGSEVTDGDAFIHPDAYRMFLLGVNSWSVEQEEGFRYLVFKEKKRLGAILTEGEQAHINEVDRLIKKNGYYFQFPKIKFQYRGGSKPKGEQPVSNIELLDKFALTPLFPDLIRGKVGEPIYDQMTKEGVAYGKFSTGTKIGTYQVDDLLTSVRNGQPVIFNSTHEILLDFMKEQIKTSNTLKVKNIFGSQVRKLIVSNLSIDGIIMKDLRKWVDQWKSGQRDIANNERNKIIIELGGDPNEASPEINKQKFVDLLNKELTKRELPKAFIDIFKDFKEDDNFEEALSPQVIETLLYSVLKNRIVKAKFPGGQLVQVSSSLFDSIETGRDLKFYRKENGKILPADCKVTLSGDFLNLLNLKEVKNLIETGLEPVDAINQLLRDDKFREKYKKQLTIFAYRIPTQGYNSMDIFMVKAFIPSYMGNTIVLPPEIVTKSGTDYDYDKASVVLPSINRSGQYIQERSEQSIGVQYDKLYKYVQDQFAILKSEEFKASLKLFGDFDSEIDISEFVESRLIRDGQLITKPEFIKELQDSIRNKISYNQIIDSAEGILLNPINFARLVTPNSTEDIYPAIKNVLDAIGVKVFTPEDVRIEPRDTQIILYVTSLQKWKAVKIKDLLGIAAVNNTFYTLMQEANLKLNKTLFINGVEFPFTTPLLTKKEQTQVSLSDPYIVGSDLDKLEIINQIINLTVDAASDDIAGYTNLIRDNTGFVLFQTMLGVPLERIFNLIHQPVVYKYHQVINEGLSNGLTNSEAKKIAYQQLFGFASLKINNFNQTKNKTANDYWKEISNIEVPEHFGKLKLLNRNQINSHKITLKDRSVLAYYLQGIEQANALRQAQSYLNFDTTTSPSYLYSAQRETYINDITKTGLFDLKGIDKIKRDSVISQLDIHSLFKLLSENLFSFKRDEQYVDEVVRLANEVYDNTDAFLRVFDNDFLMFIVQNFGNSKDVGDVKNLLVNGKLIKEWNRLKKKYPQLENFIIGKKLIANFSKETEFTNPQFFMGLDQDVEEYDAISDEIRGMLNGVNPEFQEFASNLIKVGFYQTGFNQSPVYLMKALPFEEVRKFLKPAYDNYLKLNDYQRQIVINEFSQDFLFKRARQFGKYFLDEYKRMGIKFDDLRKTAQKESWRFLDYRRRLNLKLNKVQDAFLTRQDLKSIDEMIKSGKITYTDDDGKPCAKMGMKSDKFTKGGSWEMIKTFRGASHERGGIDIEIGNGGIKMSGKQGKFEAKFGLVINKQSLKS